MTGRKHAQKPTQDRGMTEGATQFTFQATLLATISVEAATQAEGERKLRTVLETSDANLGFLDNAPIVVPVAIEGDLDLIEASRTYPASARQPKATGTRERTTLDAADQTDE
jgi:hypothetical protein